jgi:hypothetical protein
MRLFAIGFERPFDAVVLRLEHPHLDEDQSGR